MRVMAPAFFADIANMDMNWQKYQGERVYDYRADNV